MITLTDIEGGEPLLDEVQLALKARSDAEAFAELYRRYVTRIYRYHMARTGSPRDSEDLTSQTFTAALEGIRSFRGSGSFAAWLFGIATRRKAMHFRKVRPEIQLDQAAHLADPSEPPDRIAYRNLSLDSLVRALGGISPDRAEAIRLCYFGELSAGEAGRALGKTEAAVRMLVSRGLQDLRERTSLRLEVEE
jgi:RNA polymerase sigma-70 factor (ECF subfamily)